jgi:uncharacterized membrane protein YkvA (DUF1232 family)
VVEQQNKPKKMADKSNLVSRILKSVFYRAAGTKAGRYARNSASLFSLIRDTLQKSGGLSGEHIKTVRDQLNVLTRMLKAYANGQYKEIPWKTVLRVIAVLIYFVSPLDFIPDMLPIIGLTDDIALIFWLYGSIQSDIEAFKIWENQKDIVPIG